MPRFRKYSLVGLIIDGGDESRDETKTRVFLAGDDRGSKCDFILLTCAAEGCRSYLGRGIMGISLSAHRKAQPCACRKCVKCDGRCDKKR